MSNSNKLVSEQCELDERYSSFASKPLTVRMVLNATVCISCPKFQSSFNRVPSWNSIETWNNKLEAFEEDSSTVSPSWHECSTVQVGLSLQQRGCRFRGKHRAWVYIFNSRSKLLTLCRKWYRERGRSMVCDRERPADLRIF